MEIFPDLVYDHLPGACIRISVSTLTGIHDQLSQSLAPLNLNGISLGDPLE